MGLYNTVLIDCKKINKELPKDLNEIQTKSFYECNMEIYRINRLGNIQVEEATYETPKKKSYITIQGKRIQLPCIQKVHRGWRTLKDDCNIHAYALTKCDTMWYNILMEFKKGKLRKFKIQKEKC